MDSGSCSFNRVHVISHLPPPLPFPYPPTHQLLQNSDLFDTGGDDSGSEGGSDGEGAATAVPPPMEDTPSPEATPKGKSHQRKGGSEGEKQTKKVSGQIIRF